VYQYSMFGTLPEHTWLFVLLFAAMAIAIAALVLGKLFTARRG
jgi:hypothetical protein